jgi:type I restriction enzyme R subunit
MSFTEEKLEKAVIELFANQQIKHVDGRTVHKEVSDVLLRDDLKQFLLNQYADKGITLTEVDSIIRQLDLFPSSALYESNRSILKMIADGFVIKREDRSKKDLFIQLLDFSMLAEDASETSDRELKIAAEPGIKIQRKDRNIYKIVNQLEILGYEKRIPDAIVYINGLPLVVIEFKSAVKENATIRNAYDQITVRYRRDIPELFKYNAFCVISDGVNNKSGSIFAQYDFFYAWRKAAFNEAQSDGIDSLFTMVHGLFDRQRLMDVIQNFIHFPDKSNNEQKIMCRYPQYYAARKLFENIKLNMRPLGNGKGGTYFGATGCGKSFTMLFLTRLLMRSVHFESPTIVLITDRTDLDDQLSAQFTNAKGFIGDQNVISVETREELKTALQNKMQVT